jgi:hypothetical protein
MSHFKERGQRLARIEGSTQAWRGDVGRSMRRTTSSRSAYLPLEGPGAGGFAFATAAACF